MLALWGLVPSVAMADEGTEIATAFEKDNPFDLFIGLRYHLESRTTSILREWNSSMQQPASGALPVVKDLVYKQNRHTITPHLELGVYHDVQLSVALPVVITDNRTLEFDQRAGSCSFTGPNVNCIDRRNSTTLIDGFLPNGSTGQLGYDAAAPMINFAPDSRLVFRGVERNGLDQVHLGFAWAPLNQKKDDTKPTWVIGSELRLSIGKLMKFNRDDPGSETGVSRGVDEIRVYTGLAKRTTWAVPFVYFWWQAPIGIRGQTPGDPDGSLFWDVNLGQERDQPRQEAGVSFGFDAIPWEDVDKQQQIGLQLRGRIDAHFEGLGYSEMWEVFSYAGDIGDPGNPMDDGPLVLDSDPDDSDDMPPMPYDPLAHPGVTNIENYLTFGGSIGVNGKLGETARFSADFELSHDQRHRITFTDAGQDDSGNGVVDQGTTEVDPLHHQFIDLVGRRYVAGGSFIVTFLLSGTILF